MHHVLKRMEATGCDLFVDVHGDEELTYNFIAGNEGIPAWDERLEKLQVRPDLTDAASLSSPAPEQSRLPAGYSPNACSHPEQCPTVTGTSRLVRLMYIALRLHAPCIGTESISIALHHSNPPHNLLLVRHCCCSDTLRT